MYAVHHSMPPEAPPQLTGALQLPSAPQRCTKQQQPVPSRLPAKRRPSSDAEPCRWAPVPVPASLTSRPHLFRTLMTLLCTAVAPATHRCPLTTRCCLSRTRNGTQPYRWPCSRTQPTHPCDRLATGSLLWYASVHDSMVAPSRSGLLESHTDSASRNKHATNVSSAANGPEDAPQSASTAPTSRVKQRLSRCLRGSAYSHTANLPAYS